ncbi:MAG: hypothetical protein JXA82_19235 [Sedimentisphaerales bacterium]|nr:hypothetical protein [Sedimentisphaerales bacterium]
MDWFEIAEELTPKIVNGDIETVISRVSGILRSLPESPFHLILGLEFTNRPVDVAEYFDNFLKAQKAKFKIGAVYTETNGFDINPDRWYFELFAYSEYGGHEDYDWLSDWDSEHYPCMTLTGLKSLQEVYDSDAFHDEAHEEACQFCSLLVVCKFQDLIRRSVPLMRELYVPLLATSHDYDFIAEFRK